MKTIAERLSEMKKTDFASLEPRDEDSFPYRSCTLSFWLMGENRKRIIDGKVHVVCTDFEIPPEVARIEEFDSIEDALANFKINGRALGELICDIEINPPPTWDA